MNVISIFKAFHRFWAKLQPWTFQATQAGFVIVRPPRDKRHFRFHSCIQSSMPQPKSQPDRPTGYGDMALLRKFAKNNEKCSISVTHGPIGPKFWLWQYLQGIGGPYEANSSSNRTPSMRKWASTLSVICPR